MEMKGFFDWQALTFNFGRTCRHSLFIDSSFLWNFHDECLACFRGLECCYKMDIVIRGAQQSWYCCVDCKTFTFFMYDNKTRRPLSEVTSSTTEDSNLFLISSFPEQDYQQELIDKMRDCLTFCEKNIKPCKKTSRNEYSGVVYVNSDELPNNVSPFALASPKPQVKILIFCKITFEIWDEPCCKNPDTSFICLLHGCLTYKFVQQVLLVNTFMQKPENCLHKIDEIQEEIENTALTESACRKTLKESKEETKPANEESNCFRENTFHTIKEDDVEVLPDIRGDICANSLKIRPYTHRRMSHLLCMIICLLSWSHFVESKLIHVIRPDDQLQHFQHGFGSTDHLVIINVPDGDSYNLAISAILEFGFDPGIMLTVYSTSHREYLIHRQMVSTKHNNWKADLAKTDFEQSKQLDLAQYYNLYIGHFNNDNDDNLSSEIITIFTGYNCSSGDSLFLDKIRKRKTFLVTVRFPKTDLCPVYKAVAANNNHILDLMSGSSLDYFRDDYRDIFLKDIGKLFETDLLKMSNYLYQYCSSTHLHAFSTTPLKAMCPYILSQPYNSSHIICCLLTVIITAFTIVFSGRDKVRTYRLGVNNEKELKGVKPIPQRKLNGSYFDRNVSLAEHNECWCTSTGLAKKQDKSNQKQGTILFKDHEATLKNIEFMKKRLTCVVDGCQRLREIVSLSCGCYHLCCICYQQRLCEKPGYCPSCDSSMLEKYVKIIKETDFKSKTDLSATETPGLRHEKDMADCTNYKSKPTETLIDSTKLKQESKTEPETYFPQMLRDPFSLSDFKTSSHQKCFSGISYARNEELPCPDHTSIKQLVNDEGNGRAHNKAFMTDVETGLLCEEDIEDKEKHNLKENNFGSDTDETSLKGFLKEQKKAEDNLFTLSSGSSGYPKQSASSYDFANSSDKSYCSESETDINSRMKNYQSISNISSKTPCEHSSYEEDMDSAHLSNCTNISGMEIDEPIMTKANRTALTSCEANYYTYEVEENRLDRELDVSMSMSKDPILDEHKYDSKDNPTYEINSEEFEKGQKNDNENEQKKKTQFEETIDGNLDFVDNMNTFEAANSPISKLPTILICNEEELETNVTCRHFEKEDQKYSLGKEYGYSLFIFCYICIVIMHEGMITELFQFDNVKEKERWINKKNKDSDNFLEDPYDLSVKDSDYDSMAESTKIADENPDNHLINNGSTNKRISDTIKPGGNEFQNFNIDSVLGASVEPISHSELASCLLSPSQTCVINRVTGICPRTPRLKSTISKNESNTASIDHIANNYQSKTSPITQSSELSDLVEISVDKKELPNADISDSILTQADKLTEYSTEKVSFAEYTVSNKRTSDDDSVKNKPQFENCTDCCFEELSSSGGETDDPSHPQNSGSRVRRLKSNESRNACNLEIGHTQACNTEFSVVIKADNNGKTTSESKNDMENLSMPLETQKTKEKIKQMIEKTNTNERNSIEEPQLKVDDERNESKLKSKISKNKGRVDRIGITCSQFGNTNAQSMSKKSIKNSSSQIYRADDVEMSDLGLTHILDSGTSCKFDSNQISIHDTQNQNGQKHQNYPIFLDNDRNEDGILQQGIDHQYVTQHVSMNLIDNASHTRSRKRRKRKKRKKKSQNSSRSSVDSSFLLSVNDSVKDKNDMNKETVKDSLYSVSQANSDLIVQTGIIEEKIKYLSEFHDSMTERSKATKKGSKVIPENKSHAPSTVRKKKYLKEICRKCHRSIWQSNERCDSGSHITFGNTFADEVNNVRREVISRYIVDIAKSVDSGFASIESIKSEINSELEKLKRIIGVRYENINFVRKQKKSLLDKERKIKEELKKEWMEQLYHPLGFRPANTDGIVYPAGLQGYFQRLEQGPMSHEESLSYEWLRLHSLRNYRGNGSIIQLSHHGFYHDEEYGPNATRCYCCNVMYSDWNYFDNIQEVHRRLSPNCPLLSVNEEISQTPMPNDAEPSQSSLQTTEGPDENRNLPVNNSNRESSVGNVTASLEGTHIGGRSMVPEGYPSQPTEDRDNAEFLRATPSIAGGPRAIGAIPRNVQTTTHGMSSLTSQTDINNTATGARSNESTGEKSTVTSQPSNTQSRTPSYTPAIGGAGKLREINRGNGGFSTPGDSVVYGVGDPRLVNVEHPKHQDYRTIQSRSSSFTSLWPSYLDQTPRQMAEAGFFYAGVSKSSVVWEWRVADFTRCFACGGGLRNWEAGDDPCLEHTRWYPRCEYMNKLKGTRFVEAVTRRQEQHMAEQRRRQQQLQQQRQQVQSQSNNTPPDPLSTPAAATLLEMGYTRERIREAFTAVRRNTGHNSVNAEQALLWILDQDERESQSQANNTSSQSSTTGAIASVSTSASSSASGGSSRASSNSSTATASSTSASGGSSSVSNSTTTASSASASVGSSSTSSTKTTTTVSSASATGTSSQGQKSQGQGGSSKGSGKKNDDKKKDDKGGEKNEGKDSQKKGAEGEQPASGKKKKNGKKKGKGGGANGSLGGAPSVVGGATGGKAEESSNKEEEKLQSQSEVASLDTQSLKEENQKLREMQTCKICMDKPVNMTLLPCGHLVCCENCVPHLRKCPICRKRIEGSVKTYMS